jgi:hypothetical protein
MKRVIFALAAVASLALAGCKVGDPVPTSPGAIASHSVLDEKAGIAAETAYYAANRAAALAIRAGVVTDTATIKRIGELDNQAKAAVQLTRDAYDAGNAAGYDEAFRKADAATKALLELIK